mmetsp:Transcript_28499/g.91981  ORF Transcript_28499/g.91981 Transcript_28499/m.91981 type:complete len:119 (-) Transcript_28499:32-388(-)
MHALHSVPEGNESCCGESPPKSQEQSEDVQASLVYVYLLRFPHTHSVCLPAQSPSRRQRAHLMEAVLTLFYTLLLLACFVLGSDTARLVLPSEKDGDHEHLMIASFTTSSLHFLLQRM